jgi:hypothetical protein
MAVNLIALKVHEHHLIVTHEVTNTGSDRSRRETVEHPFGTLKMRMGATHFLMKRLPKVATEMALHVLTYNLTRVMNEATHRGDPDVRGAHRRHQIAHGRPGKPRRFRLAIAITC